MVYFLAEIGLLYLTTYNCIKVRHDKTLFASIVLQLNCTKSPMSYLFFV